MPETFYREQYDELWLQLRASEELGLTGGGFVEDYNGVPGQMTVRHVETGDLYPVPLSEVPGETPAVPHDVFTGYLLLIDLPDGTYEVLGRVRDPTGNVAILNAFATPTGTEQLQTGVLQFVVLPGEAPQESGAPAFSGWGRLSRRTLRFLTESRERERILARLVALLRAEEPPTWHKMRAIFGREVGIGQSIVRDFALEMLAAAFDRAIADLVFVRADNWAQATELGTRIVRNYLLARLILSLRRDPLPSEARRVVGRLKPQQRTELVQ